MAAGFHENSKNHARFRRVHYSIATTVQVFHVQVKLNFYRDA